MTRRAWIAIALVAIAAALLVVGVAKLTSGSSGESSGSDASGSAAATQLRRLVRAARPAADPFGDLTQSSGLAVGGRCVHVVIADREAERVQGLRQRSDIGPYDGMLFVFDSPTTVGFTMSTVPVGLDIGFYRADGTLVSTRRMQPCPKAENECPVYTAGAPFSYALETLPDHLPSGGLAVGSCPS